MDSTKEHLYVILAMGRGVACTVNLTSIKPKPHVPDRACLVSPGEHPFVVVQSYVYYGKAGWEDIDYVTALHDTGPRRQPPVSPALLGRMRAGARLSDHIVPFVLERLEEVLRAEERQTGGQGHSSAHTTWAGSA